MQDSSAATGGPPTPLRQVRLWTPSIMVRRGEGGVHYVEQDEPLPASP